MPRNAFPARRQRAPVEDLPFPQRGVPGGWRDWTDSDDVRAEILTARQEQEALAVDIAAERQAQQAERDIRRRRRHSPRARGG